MRPSKIFLIAITVSSQPTLPELGITKEISSQVPGKPYLSRAITAKVTERQIIVERLN